MVNASVPLRVRLNDLPAPVAAYISASNGFDLDAVMATFAESLAGERPALRVHWLAGHQVLGGARNHR